MDVIEAMETCIAMRYLKEDPIPKADLERLIYAATRASSPGNSQEWEFVVLSDAALKAEIGDAVWAAVAPMFESLAAVKRPEEELNKLRITIKEWKDVNMIRTPDKTKQNT